MTFYPESGDLAQRVAELEKRLAAMERSDRLIASSVGAGGMRVLDGGAVRSGDFDGEDLDTPGTDGWWLGPEGIVVNRAVIRTGFQIRTGLGWAIYNDVPYGDSLDPPWTDIANTLVAVPDWATVAQVIGISNGTAFLAPDAGEMSLVSHRVNITGGDSMVDPEDGEVAEVRLEDVPSPGDYTAHTNAHQRTLTDLGTDINVKLQAYYLQVGAGSQSNWVYGSVTSLVVFTDE